MTPTVRLIAVFLPTLSLASGCATSQPRPDSETATPPAVITSPAPAPATAVVRTSLEPQVLYDVLVGEIAGQRGDLDASVQSYLRAVTIAPDPRLAERATRIALYAKDYDDALRAAERWAQLDPGSVEAHEALGALHLHRGQMDLALADLEQVVGKLGPEQGFRLVAALLRKEDDRQASMRLMDMLVARHAQEPNAHYAEALLAMLVEQPDAALAAVNQALSLKPDWDEARILRARLLAQQGKTSEALADLKEAVSHDPKDRELRLTYARLLLLAGQNEAARRQFEQLLKSSEDDAEVLYALALLQIDAQHLGDAEDYLERLLKTGKHVQEAYYYLGRIHEFRGDKQPAMLYYGNVEEGELRLDAQIRIANLLAGQGDVAGARRRLTELRDQNPKLAVRLYLAEGEILTNVGQYQNAMQIYDRAIGEAPQDPDLLYARALLAEKLNRLEVTEHDLRDILSRDPDNANALNALGYTLADRTTRYQEAKDYIERALQQLPDDPAVLDSMGWVQYRLGNYQEAVRYLRRALDLSKDGDIAAHLGEVLWVMGQQDSARKVWQPALQDHPDNQLLREVMQRLVP